MEDRYQREIFQILHKCKINFLRKNPNIFYAMIWTHDNWSAKFISWAKIMRKTNYIHSYQLISNFQFTLGRSYWVSKAEWIRAGVSCLWILVAPNYMPMPMCDRRPAVHLSHTEFRNQNWYIQFKAWITNSERNQKIKQKSSEFYIGNHEQTNMKKQPWIWQQQHPTKSSHT